MKIDLMDKAKKKRFIEGISYSGVEKIPYLLMKSGQDRVRAFSGSLSNEELLAIWRLFPIEGVGLYFGKEIVDKKNGRKETRLSLDALHILKDQIKGNVVELDAEQEAAWFRGKNVEGSFDKEEFVAVKSAESGDFIGTGKVSADKKVLISFLPKERWIKDSNL